MPSCCCCSLTGPSAVMRQSWPMYGGLRRQRPSHANNLKFRALKWATVYAPRPLRGQVPQTDILQLDAIIGACFTQQDPINSGLFYFNHWVANIAYEGMQVCCSACYSPGQSLTVQLSAVTDILIRFATATKHRMEARRCFYNVQLAQLSTVATAVSYILSTVVCQRLSSERILS